MKKWMKREEKIRMKLFYVALALFGGLMVGIQAPINGALGKRIGGIEGAFVSFFVGTITLLVALLILGRGNISEIINVPKGLLIGGVLGSIFVTANIFSVPRIGVAAAITSAILGQMIAGLVIDHFGLLGVARNPISLSRVSGTLFIMFGLFLILRRNL
jgi:bacterial/archaeal transporter family-2 protein